MKEKNLKMKENNKRIFYFLCMCIVLLIIYEAIHIYAIFHSEVDGDVQLENGTWKIVVNGTQVSDGVQKNFVIDSVSAESNEHVKEGNIAPGMTGSFQIKIDPTDTDVSVGYDITVNNENLGNSNFRIKSVQEVEVGNQLTETAENTYTGIIPLSDIQKGVTNTLKVEVEWIDSEENSEEDLKIGTTYDAKLEIPISLNIYQYIP